MPCGRLITPNDRHILKMRSLLMPLKAVNYINTEPPLGHNMAVVVGSSYAFVTRTHSHAVTHKANTQNRCHDNTTSETNDNNDVGNGGGGSSDSDNDRRMNQDKNCFLAMQNDSLAHTHSSLLDWLGIDNRLDTKWLQASNSKSMREKDISVLAMRDNLRAPSLFSNLDNYLLLCR